MAAVQLTTALLDTQPLLWALADDARLPASLGEAITADPTRFGVSDVSLWEIAIKRSTGKLRVADDLPTVIVDVGFSPVAITSRQVWAVRDLPFHHRDPFDRLLVAQARDLGIPIVSGDTAFAAYEVAVSWEPEGPAARPGRGS